MKENKNLEFYVGQPVSTVRISNLVYTYKDIEEVIYPNILVVKNKNKYKEVLTGIEYEPINDRKSQFYIDDNKPLLNPIEIKFPIELNKKSLKLIESYISQHFLTQEQRNTGLIQILSTYKVSGMVKLNYNYDFTKLCLQ